LGGKKKESKGLFGKKPVAVPNRGIHQNVARGDQLNRQLEDQFYLARGYHAKHNRGFNQ